jgi:hypothetical protein
MEVQTLRTTSLKEPSNASHAPSARSNEPAPRCQDGTSRDPGAVGPATEAPDAPCVETLIAEWLKFHVALLAAPDRYHYSVAHLKTFFNDERRAGRLGGRVMVKDLTPELQSRFREWRSASTHGQPRSRCPPGGVDLGMEAPAH